MHAQEFVLCRIRESLPTAMEEAEILSIALEATGLDSLDLMELLNEIEDAYDIRFDDRAIREGGTVGELIAYIDAAMKLQL